jgi:hypothetical protein
VLYLLVIAPPALTPQLVCTAVLSKILEKIALNFSIELAVGIGSS